MTVELHLLHKAKAVRTRNFATNETSWESQPHNTTESLLLTSVMNDKMKSGTDNVVQWQAFVTDIRKILRGIHPHINISAEKLNCIVSNGDNLNSLGHS